MEPTNEYRSIPAAALRFSGGEMELGDNGEGAKTAPIRMVARSGRAIEHWYWGKVVHDLEGMQLHKPRLPVDYNHEVPIGYLNKFDIESGDLVVSGALVPTSAAGDPTPRLIELAHGGVPFEASINFGGDGIEVEQIAEGKSINVNHHKFSGPGVVIRKWPLRGVAVVPYGADANTVSEFANSGDYRVKFIQKENTMDNDAKVEELESVDTPAVNDIAEEAAPCELEQPELVTPDGESVYVEPAVELATLSEAELRAAEGKKFLDRFGTQGAIWFAEGLSYDDAFVRYVELLEAENAAFKAAKQPAKPEGEETPVEFSPAPTKPPVQFNDLFKIRR